MNTFLSITLFFTIHIYSLSSGTMWLEMAWPLSPLERIILYFIICNETLRRILSIVYSPRATDTLFDIVPNYLSLYSVIINKRFISASRRFYYTGHTQLIFDYAMPHRKHKNEIVQQIGWYI